MACDKLGDCGLGISQRWRAGIDERMEMARGNALDLLILNSGPARGRSDRPPCYLCCYCVQGARPLGHSRRGHGRLLLPSMVSSILPLTLEPTGVSIQKTPARCRQARVARPTRQSFAIRLISRLCQQALCRQSFVSLVSADVLSTPAGC